jgi:hypothetical protein
MDSVRASETGMLGGFDEAQLSLAASEGWALVIRYWDCHCGS